MNLSNLQTGLQKNAKMIQGKVVKRAPQILLGIGISGMFGTVVWAVAETPKALRLIEEAEAKKIKDQVEQGIPEEEAEGLKPVEVIKVAWKPYLPVAITALTSATCIIAAGSISAGRTAALATAYTLSETARKEYRDKVVETIGEKKEIDIREKVIKDKVEKNPVSNAEVIVTGNRNTLCYDIVSGRYFYSDYDAIKKAENALNKRLISEMYISLNEFYYELGMRPTKLGNELGWNVNDCLIDLTLSSQLADDGRPCLAVDYCVAPRYDYRS